MYLCAGYALGLGSGGSSVASLARFVADEAQDFGAAVEVHARMQMHLQHLSCQHLCFCK